MSSGRYGGLKMIKSNESLMFWKRFEVMNLISFGNLAFASKVSGRPWQ